MNDSEVALVVYSAALTILAFLFCWALLNMSEGKNKVLREQNLILNQTNLHLTNLLASKDALAFQQIQAVTAPSQNLGFESIPMDDLSEYERWINAQGLGDVLNGEDTPDPDGDNGRAELLG